MKMVVGFLLIAVPVIAVWHDARACEPTVSRDVSLLLNSITSNQLTRRNSLLTTGKIPILANAVSSARYRNAPKNGLLTTDKIPILANSVASEGEPLDFGEMGFDIESLDWAQNVAGKWTLSARDPVQSCDVELIRAGTMTGGNVVSGFGCPDGFFNVVNWQVDGVELRFLSPTGRVMARFYQTMWGWQGERENDGAVLILTEFDGPFN
jgi:hypothetical protein